MQGVQAGTLAITNDGKQLTQQLFNPNINTILQQVKVYVDKNVNPSLFAIHQDP